MRTHDGKARELDVLHALLAQWVMLSKEQWAIESAHHRATGTPDELLKKWKINWHEQTERMAEEARPFLAYFLRDNSGLNAEELENIAEKLSPGGAHTGGWLAILIRRSFLRADRVLLAAVMRYNWHGGKKGFQFLPNPAEIGSQKYQDSAAGLMELFKIATDCDPCRILTGDDRDFYKSLPDRFTVYRGCAGVLPDLAAAGVCWTMKRDIAEWFAYRAVSAENRGATGDDRQSQKTGGCFCKINRVRDSRAAATCSPNQLSNAP